MSVAPLSSLNVEHVHRTHELAVHKASDQVKHVSEHSNAVLLAELAKARHDDPGIGVRIVNFACALVGDSFDSTKHYDFILTQ